jgi:hypothetical protein
MTPTDSPDQPQAQRHGPAALPSVVKLFEWLPTFVIVTGIAGLITDSIDFAVAVVVIVVGSVASGALARLSPAVA